MGIIPASVSFGSVPIVVPIWPKCSVRYCDTPVPSRNQDRRPVISVRASGNASWLVRIRGHLIGASKFRQFSLRFKQDGGVRHIFRVQLLFCLVVFLPQIAVSLPAVFLAVLILLRENNLVILYFLVFRITIRVEYSAVLVTMPDDGQANDHRACGYDSF